MSKLKAYNFDKALLKKKKNTLTIQSILITLAINSFSSF